MEELPKLTDKENKCMMRYLVNGHVQNEAYRYGYDCSNMSDKSVDVEASRFFKNPKITLWLDKFRDNTHKTIQEVLKYDALKHFAELDEMKQLALGCRDKYSNPNVNAALKSVELKGKLAGLYKDEKEEMTGNNTVTVMGSISLDGKKLDFNVGEAVDNEQSSTSENS